MELSIIVPFYNEEECIEAMYKALVDALDPLGLSYEMLFVDDGSRDTTAEIATRIAKKDKRLRFVKFRRNYGQTPAMAAGIDHARGKILITMDGDLQNDPRDIPLFLEKIKEGYDIVVGWRFNRQDKLITRKIPSRIANWIIGKVTGVPIKDNGCSLKAYRATVIKNIPLYSEMHRFIPAMASLSGARIAEIKVRHHAREFGESKYGLSRIYKVLIDLLTIKTIVSFASRPILWFSIMAAIAAIFSLTAFTSVLYSAAIHPGESLVVMMGLCMLLGSLAVFLLFSGVLCELIYKTGDQRIEDLSRLTIKTEGFNEHSKEVIHK
ncbi:MAG: glycosyltransferase family 2 protein [Gammaproteobacteria bacterium]|nr:glycosyltransferase family 2 protein [Gammaproteobacteria bacterium]